MPGAAVYSATKSFVTSFSECLWFENKDKGIYIFADSPGAVDTPFHENAGRETDVMESKMILSPEYVVGEAMKKLEERKRPSFINGSQYRFITKITSIFSRKFRLARMAESSPALN